jgi:NAD(P)H-flavin reductase
MPAAACRAILDRVDILSYNVRSFRLKLQDPPAVDFTAGQFFIVNVPKDGQVVKRAYSVASPPHEKGVLELCIQHVEGGAASTWFWKLKGGETLHLTGPHGKFTLREPLDYDPVFVATGTGVAPLRSMIRHLFHINCARDIWLLFGTRYEHAILYESEFRQLAGLRHNFHYVPCISRPKEWRGETGHVQDLFKKYITDWSNKEMYLCGWDVVIKAVMADLEGFGVPKAQLHFEEWG